MNQATTLGIGMLRLKFIFFVFMLLFASLHSHSKDVNLADADYCLDWKSEKTEIKRGEIPDVYLVFVKKNNDLKKHTSPIMCAGENDVQLHLSSVSYMYTFSSYFYFINTSGREIFSFEQIGKINAGIMGSVDGYSTAHTWLLPDAEIDFPSQATLLTTSLEKFNKNNLLWFKNRIIDAQIWQKVECVPNLDTTYRIDFSIRIIGECGCDSTEYKKNFQKNKK
jgi:hypothetical protein